MIRAKQISAAGIVVVIGVLYHGTFEKARSQQCHNGCQTVKWYAYMASEIGDQGYCYARQDYAQWCDSDNAAWTSGTFYSRNLANKSVCGKNGTEVVAVKGRCPLNCTDQQGLYPQEAQDSMITPVVDPVKHHSAKCVIQQGGSPG